MTKRRQADAADEDEEIMPDEAVDDDLLADEPAAVREELRRKLKTEGVRTAIDTMLEVCRDRKAQASARATCAIGLMRGAGYLSKKAEEEDEVVPIPQMDARLRQLRAGGARRRAPRHNPQEGEDDLASDNGGVFD